MHPPKPIDADRFDRWVGVREAADRLGSHLNDHEMGRVALTRRLQAGLLIAAAASAVWHGADFKERSSLVLIPEGQWAGISSGPDSILWRSGDVDADLRSPTRYGELEPLSYVQYFGVRLDLDGLNAIAPIFGDDVAIVAPLPAQGRARPGPRRKDWWDMLWIEMIRRIVAGTLTPRNQAALEREMLDFLSEMNEFPGEGTLKRSAANLFRFLEEIRGN